MTYHGVSLQQSTKTWKMTYAKGTCLKLMVHARWEIAFPSIYFVTGIEMPFANDDDSMSLHSPHWLKPWPFSQFQAPYWNNDRAKKLARLVLTSILAFLGECTRKKERERDILTLTCKHTHVQTPIAQTHSRPNLPTSKFAHALTRPRRNSPTPKGTRQTRTRYSYQTRPRSSSPTFKLAHVQTRPRSSSPTFKPAHVQTSSNDAICSSLNTITILQA